MDTTNIKDFIWIIYLQLFYLGIFHHTVVCEEYCFGKQFRAECNSSDVILLETARYGRMYSGECITADESSLGCYGNVIDYLDSACSGRVECVYPVQDLDDKVSGCYRNDRLRFLDATYMCIQVPNNTVCIHSEMVFNSTDVGYLKGPWNPSTGNLFHLPGTQTCPWTLVGQPGQRIQISLVDISLRTTLNLLQVNQQPLDPCPIRLHVNDAGDTIERQLCHDSYEREIPLYISTSSSIQVYVVQEEIASDNEVFYLFHYQVVGCIDVPAPDHTWIQRHHDTLTVRCNASGDTWYLVCRDNEWFGQLGNCTPTLTATTQAPENSEGFPWGIVIAVAIGIAIGVIVGLLMLGLVIAVIKWRDGKKKKKASQRPDLRNIEVPYNTTAQMQKTQDSIKRGQGSAHGVVQAAHLAQVTTYPDQHASSLYQPGPSRLQHQYSTVSDPSNPMYHFYDQQNQETSGRPPLERQNTAITNSDEHVYETAYFTRPPTVGKETERETRQKSLAKEYFEMRESPQGTLESAVNKETQPTKY